MKSVTIIQHVACESAGTLEQELRNRAIGFHYVRPYLGDAIPVDTTSVDGLIVMGGPMGVYESDRYPFLREEMALLADASSRGLPVIGICLGSQLLAAALGATVRPGGFQEIGWHDVTLLPDAEEDPLFAGLPKQFAPLHWHGDVFDLPQDAKALARSAKTPIQAFRAASASYGLLFHLEVTTETLGGMVRTFESDLVETGQCPKEFLANAPSQLAKIESLGQRVFRRWCELILVE